VLSLQLLGFMAMLAGTAMVLWGYMNRREVQQHLRQHIDLVVPLASAELGAKGFPARLEGWINRPVRRTFAVGLRYSWGMQSGAALLLAIAAVSAAVGWLLPHRMLGTSAWLPIVLSAIACFWGPRTYLKYQQRKAEHLFIEYFPGSIDAIIRMLRAGLPITSAIQELQTQAQPPLDAVYKSIADQIGLGVPFERAIEVASERIGLADFRFFAVALTLQQSTGGNLIATLENLSDVIRKRRAMRLKAIAVTAEVRVSAYVLGAMPVLTIGALLLLRPDYVSPLFYDARGKYILAAAAGFLLLAFLTMRQMMRRVASG
jgi:tight adherence protein B